MFSPAYRRYFLVLMMLVTAFAVVDRVALLTMGQAIKEDLGITDFQFGIVSGLGFAIIYALLGLPLARIADTRNRVRLVVASIVAWSCFTVLSGLSRNFVSLMFCRIVVGVGEAGVQPPAIAIVSDLYPPHRRGAALAILALGLPLGTLVGAVSSGYLADELSWRTVFLLLGIPGGVLSLIVWLTLRDPPRGMSDPAAMAAVPRKSDLVTAFRRLARKRSFRHIVVALALTQFAAAGIGSFLPQYFTRTMELHLGTTGLMFGIVAATSTFIGNYSGGVIVDWISARDPRWYGWLPSLGVLAAAPMYVACFVIDDPVAVIAVLIPAGALLFLHYTPTQVVLQNMVEARMRASAAFVFFLVTSMVGYGFGPMLLGLVSDTLAAHAFPAGDYASMCASAPAGGAAAALREACHAASVAGIRGAMMLMSGLFFWAACHFFMAAKTLRSDLQPGMPPGEGLVRAGAT